MSVTITIKNNRKYCQEKLMVVKTQLPCQCAGYENGMRTTGDENCEECKGEGFTMMDVYPFELNLANANFETLWRVLGLDQTAPMLDPRRILKALKKTSLSKIIKGGVRDGNTIYCGISPEQAARYKVKLTELCEEASRREEKVIWG